MEARGEVKLERSGVFVDTNPRPRMQDIGLFLLGVLHIFSKLS